MTRARGQPPRSMIDREYPHQVIVPAEDVGGDKIPMVDVALAQLEAAKGIRWLRKDDRDHLVYCFREAGQARAFQAIFGGEIKP